MSDVERIPAGRALKEWSRLLDRAKAGEEFVITRDGTEVAMLGPVRFRAASEPLAPRRYNDAVVKDILTRAFGGRQKKG